jgi:hypothetical protein
MTKSRWFLAVPSGLSRSLNVTVSVLLPPKSLYGEVLSTSHLRQTWGARLVQSFALCLSCAVEKMAR